MSRRSARALALFAVLALAAVAVVGWLTLSGRAAGWTGEEEPAAQLKGLVSLAAIWLTTRPLQLDAERPLPHTSLRPYGVSVFLEQEVDEAAVARSLDMVQAAGIGVIRQQFPWEDIEIHGKGDFEDRRHDPPRSAWAKYDRIVAQAEARGLTLIARLDAPPDWTRADRAADDTFGPPDNYADYGDFVAAVVSRYQGRLRYIQVWNEPNIFPEWGVEPPNPEAYTRLLAVAAERARAIDPAIVIISAPLAPTLQTNERGMYDLLYLERMLAAGAAAHFDILGLIAYGLGSGPDDRRAVWHRTNFARPLLIRDVMVRHGAADKPAWILEMGWSAVPERMAAPFGRVTEAQQARYVVGAYQRIEADYPWVGVACLWFFRRPNDEWFQRPEGYFRLVNPDWTPLPAYHALAAEATAPPRLATGFQYVTHPAFRLTGPWRMPPDPAQAGTEAQGAAGASLLVRYEGTTVVLVARPVAAATLEYRVDGGPPRRVELAADGGGRVEVVLRDEAQLAQGEVEVTVLSGEVVVEGVRVTRSGDGWLRRAFIVVAAAGAALGGARALWPRRAALGEGAHA